VSRNPDWSRDETILLMYLYLRAPRAGRGHPEVQGLSALLRAAARRDGAPVHPTLRNPSGIALRLRNFGRHDPAAPDGRDAGLKPGGAIDQLVWREFGDDPGTLVVEAARVRRAFARGTVPPNPLSSRGPTPWFGERTSDMEDGSTGVYLVLLDGPASLLAPAANHCIECSTVKLGRTSDLDRRIAELSGGLPPGSAITYVPLALRVFGSAAEAHAFERHLLDVCDREGWSLGGEFAYAPVRRLLDLISARWRRGVGAAPRS
jgi:hypothetical protein